MSVLKKQCVKNVIAISQSDYLAFGCPHCGCLPLAELSDSWCLLNEKGDIGECLNCGQTFFVLPNEQEYAPFEIQDKCCKEAALTKNGRSCMVPVRIRPSLSSHPRNGITHNNNCGTANPDLLPIGTICNAPLGQTQTAA